MDDKYKGCKGCITLSQEGYCFSQFIPYISETLQCPCLTCIVKVVCMASCKEFNEYSRKCTRLKPFHKGI